MREGIEGRCVYVVGNPIHEVIRHYDDSDSPIGGSTTPRLRAGQDFLVTDAPPGER